MRAAIVFGGGQFLTVIRFLTTPQLVGETVKSTVWAFTNDERAHGVQISS